MSHGPPSKNQQPLIEIANKIRKFERSTISNAVETGRLLHEASEICEHGEYQAWIDCEFGWSYRSVNNRNAFEFAEMCNSFTFDGISDVDELNLSLSALYLVAAMKKLPGFCGSLEPSRQKIRDEDQGQVRRREGRALRRADSCD